jgi:probable F420-dependent oxidoreductase
MMELGKLGVWTGMDGMSAAAAAAFAKRVEERGYSALWIPEGRGRNALVLASWLLSNTERLVVATGIANIYARDPVAMASGERALAEQSGGRFLLGVGVSHRPSVEGRGHAYGRPVATMRAYLQAMRAAPYGAPQPAERPLTVVAALGPRMLALSAELADGAHPYNTAPEHTAKARSILGPGKLLCPEVWVLLETDGAKARAAARQALSRYMQLENYVNGWRRQGFGDADLAGGGSDRFVDAMVAWGDETAIRARIRQHWDAGADHVCIQPINPPGSRELVDERVLDLLAPGRRS